MRALAKPTALLVCAGLLWTAQLSRAAEDTTKKTQKKTTSKKTPARKVVKWVKLEAALSQAKSGNKPVVLAFVDGRYKGPATFEGKGLLKAVTDSGLLPVKIIQPTLRIPRNTKADAAKKIREKYNAELKSYKELTTKYAVTSLPKMVFLSPEGDAVYYLVRPTVQNVQTVIAGLPKILENYKAAKAAAQGKTAPAEEAKPENKKPEAPPKKK